MKLRLLLVLIASTLIISACAKKDAKLETDQQKLSYAIGHNIAQNLKQQNIELDTVALSAAFDDILSDKESRLTPEEMRNAIMGYQREKMKEREAKGEKNKSEGLAFLEKNKKKEGVKVTKSGIQYKVIKAGKGKKPKASDTVKVHYRGTLIDGREFDSSYKRKEPAKFPLRGVIKGWQEILPMMKTGAKWHIAVPSELAYGPRGQGGMIGPNSTLVFEIELLSIEKSGSN
jgi:FKBP-type peptidyl-prolyl cis-trans isomerase FklB